MAALVNDDSHINIKKGDKGVQWKDSEALQRIPLPRIVKGEKMHKNTKYWCFTWGTTVSQKKVTK